MFAWSITTGRATMGPKKKTSQVANRESSESARSTPVEDSDVGASSDDSMEGDDNYVPSETQTGGDEMEVQEEEVEDDQQGETREDDEDAEVDQLVETEEEEESQTTTKAATNQARPSKQALVLKGDERVSKVL